MTTLNIYWVDACDILWDTVLLLQRTFNVVSILYQSSTHYICSSISLLIELREIIISLGEIFGFLFGFQIINSFLRNQICNFLAIISDFIQLAFSRDIDWRTVKPFVCETVALCTNKLKRRIKSEIESIHLHFTRQV